MQTYTHKTSMWHNKNYIKLLSAQIISLSGTGISSICLALLAYNLAGDNAAMVLSISFAIKMLAYIGLAPIFGVIIHRLPKQKTLIALDIIRAVMFISLPFVTQIWQVYVLMFVINACSAGFTPLFQSTLPTILPIKHQYTTALSISRMAYDLEQLLSPLLTALFLLVVSFKSLFIFDAVTFIVSAALILTCKLPQVVSYCSDKISISSVLGNIKNYLNHPSLKSLWFAYLSAASASAMVLVNTVVYVHNILNGNEAQTAIAMMIVGLGSMIIAFLLPKLLDKYRPQRFHWLGMLTLIFAFTLGSLTPNWVGYTLVCFAMGVGMSCIQTSAGLLITDACSDGDSGPFFAAHFSLTHFWWLITYLVAGFSVTTWGLSVGYLTMGSLCLISLISYSYISIYKR
nr:MFS transporter [Photobacterium angustum]